MISLRHKLIRAGLAFLSITCLVLTGAVAYSLDIVSIGKKEATLNQQLEKHLGISHWLEKQYSDQHLEVDGIWLEQEMTKENWEELLNPEKVDIEELATEKTEPIEHVNELLAKLPPEVLLASPKPPEKKQIQQYNVTNNPTKEDTENVTGLNAQTDNLNVLFIGVAEEELLMVSLYSIDYKDSWGSAAIFFPTRTVAAGSEEARLETLGAIYKQGGVQGLTGILEQKLHISIDYHIRVDREVLKKVSEIIDPIYVEGEEVDIHNLFDMEVTPHDDYILGELVKRFSKPSVYFFSLPELFITFRRHISTDFAITPSNLYLHYQIARQIKPELVQKTILVGHNYYRKGEMVQELPEETWENIVYRLTKKQ